LNAANEIAVSAFIEKKIDFIYLPKIIEKVLVLHKSMKDPSLEEILQADLWARRRTKKIIERMIS
jgi:1-deoxy-D-xylulose-5-phosphate reductoisomerase